MMQPIRTLFEQSFDERNVDNMGRFLNFKGTFQSNLWIIAISMEKLQPHRLANTSNSACYIGYLSV